MRTAKPLTAERLREVLHYDPESGVFTWREAGPKRVVGARAGHIDRYLLVGVDGGQYYGHRLAWLYMTGEWPTGELDHKDLDKANCKWGNIRPATHKQNMENVAVRSHSGTGVKGVHYCKRTGKFAAYLCHNWKKVHLGRFADIEDAKRARKAGEAQYFTHA